MIGVNVFVSQSTEVVTVDHPTFATVILTQQATTEGGTYRGSADVTIFVTPENVEVVRGLVGALQGAVDRFTIVEDECPDGDVGAYTAAGRVSRVPYTS